MRISDWSSDVCSSDLLPVWNDAPRDEKWRFCAPRQGVSRSEAESRRKPSAIVPLSRGTAESLPTFLKKRCADKDIRVTRSEERRVGKECVSTGRSRWSPYH